MSEHKYRRLVDGKEVSRHGPDEWLEASAGWERIEPAAEPADDQHEGSKD